VPFGKGAFLAVGLSGALLAELALGGQLRVAADGTVRAGDARPGDELLAGVYDAVREHLEGRKARRVVRDLSRRIGGSRTVSPASWPTTACSAGTGRPAGGRPGIRSPIWLPA